MADMKMLINVHEDETRIALTENNLLIDLHVQQVARERRTGNIYLGIVEKVNPAFQAAFVDYGERKSGFLSISDLNPALFGSKDGGKGRPRIQSLLKPGQPVLVQVLKEGVGHKGAALTTYISLPGRYLVLTPNSERKGISRKIADSDKRSQMREALSALAGENMGVIIRTAGTDRALPDLKRDLSTLRKTWKSIETKFNRNKKPGLLHQEASSIVRVLRDYFTEDVKEVLVDSAEAFQEALAYFKDQMPKFQKRLQLYVGDKSLFSAYGVESQIDMLDSSKVDLKSGGSIVIEPTEALVSVDVNSGRSNQAQDIEETALNTNLEAAEEIARQLRLRNLGGLVVVDFIDMMRQGNKDKVVKRLTEALRHDKARTTVGSISQFGMLELSRQRIDMDITHGLRMHCDNCGGTGYVPTVSARANQVLRKVRELAASGKYQEIQGVLALDQANFLLNNRRESLRDLEQEFEVTIRLTGDANMGDGMPVTLKGIRGSDEAAAEVESVGRDDAEESASAQDGEQRSRRGRRRRPRRRTGEDHEDMAAQDISRQDEDFEEAQEEPAPEDDEAPAAAAAREPQPRREQQPPHEARRQASAVPARDNGKSSGLVPPPVPFSIKKRGPKVFLVDLNANPPSGEAFFISHHKVSATESPVDIPLPGNDRDPFTERSAKAEPGDVLFTSRHRGEAAPIAADNGEDAPAARPSSRRRRGGRGRSAKAKGAAPAAQGNVRSPEETSAEDVNGNVKQAAPARSQELDPPEPGNEKYPPAKRGSGNRRGRGRRAGGNQSATA